MRALREHPRCSATLGDRGTRCQEMRSSNRPTKYLSSAPELLSVLRSTVTPSSEKQCEAHCTCVSAVAPKPKEWLRGVCVEVTQQGSAAGARERMSVTKRKNLAVRCSRRSWDAITKEEFASGTDKSCSTGTWFAESWSVTGKAPLQGKWVDVNKGDVEKPVVRSRYVAEEFANTKTEGFFSPTLPLGALLLLLSHAPSGRSPSTRGRKILVVDARKAHLHASAERNLHVALPPEVRVPGVCARVRRSSHGIRSAPARWEAFLSKQLESKGFVRGLVGQRCCQHSSKDRSCVVHGHDFVFAGVDSDLEWARQQMEKSFLVKVIGRPGGDKQDVRELRAQNRVLSWRSGGIQLEADPRHQEILISELEQDVRGTGRVDTSLWSNCG